jgi:hypothetical protein
MSDEKKIDAKDLQKALDSLQDLAKGHNSRGTATTQVDSMRDGAVGAGGNAGATQVHHTAANSNPKGWAGSKEEDCGEDGAHDSIDENGTDYRGGAMAKSILKKLSKGQPLTAAEYEVVKAMPAFLKKDDDDDDDKKDDKKKEDKVDKAYGKDDDDDDDDDDDKKDVKKSLVDEAASNETVAQGMEISEFLAEFVGTINKSLSNLEERVVRRVLSAVSESDSRSNEFGKSLASALGTLGEGLVAQTQRVDQIEGQPARGPKSQQTLSKGFSGPRGEELSKSQIAAALVDMVENNKIDAAEVIRFDATAHLSEDTLAKVHAHRAGK